MTALEKLRSTGIRRLGTPKTGFRHVTADGRPVSTAEEARIRALRLPPAWVDVHVNPVAHGKLQAVGRDRAGRWQYRYHPSFVHRQERRKFERLLAFAEALPHLRAVIDRDLSRPHLDRPRVMACVLRILSTCFLRPGSEAYASEHGSYGIATLRRRHVKVRGDRVIFDFRGKSGQQQHREIRDRRVARVVRQLLGLPGVEVFKFLDDTGALVDVKRQTINTYIHEVMGNGFSAKDFRTWAGTLVCACALARRAEELVPGESRRRHLVAAIKETAAALGNTPAVCRASYVYPGVLSSFERGRVVARYFETLEELVEHRRPRLHASEKALLELLAHSEARAAAPKGPAPKRLPASVRRPARALAAMLERPTGAALH